MALLLTAWPLRDVSAALIALVFPLVHAVVTCAVGELYLGQRFSVAAALRVVWSLLLPVTGTMLLLWLVWMIAGAISISSISPASSQASRPRFRRPRERCQQLAYQPSNVSRRRVGQAIRAQREAE